MVLLTSLMLATVAQTALLPLSCKGKDLVDPTGKVVTLRGVNLGGWLVEEIWMTPWVNRESPDKPETVKDHASLWKTIEGRLGKDAVVRIRKAWRDNWITPADFKRIKQDGFNHVRIPFLVWLLDEPGGMDMLKYAVAQAKANGLYAVIDMHGVPGGQSGEHHTGEEKRNRLWFDVENIDAFEKAWIKVAKEFANDPTVAIYDIMNEPMGAPNPAMLHLVYDRIVKAIRKVAPNKVVMVDDGYKGFETTPHPNLAGWTNVVFSLHFYNFDAKKTEDHPGKLKERMPKLVELQGYRDAPVYAGEFNLEPFNSPKSMREFVGQFNKAGWSWALWTYKLAPAGGPMGDWGLYRPKGKIDPLNPFKDSEATLIQKMKQFRTEEMTVPAAQLSALVKG